jgi:hypothetical protein
MNKYITVLTIFFIATITCTHAFYLPGVAPKEFKVDDPVTLKYDKMDSTHTIAIQCVRFTILHTQRCREKG